MKRVSLADIAKSAGVSKSLVSLVMNDRGDSHGISKKTQKKVKAVADDLNYTPNTMARSLRTGKTDTIGLILADIGNPFYAKLARSIEDFAITKGYHLIFSSFLSFYMLMFFLKVILIIFQIFFHNILLRGMEWRTERNGT